MIDLFNLPSGVASLQDNILLFTNFEKRDSIAVIFSSFAAKNYGPKAFSYIKHFSAIHNNCDLLFVKDPHNQWYNRGIAGLGLDFYECVQRLGEIIGSYKRSVLFGSSMGAYASLLYGQMCKASTVIALAPQTFLAKPYPRFNPRIHNGEYANLSIECANPSANMIVIIGEDDLFDIYQIGKLPLSSKIQKYSLPGSHHNVVKFLDNLGLLDFIAQAVANDNINGLNHEISKLASDARLKWNEMDFNTSLIVENISKIVECFYAKEFDHAKILLKAIQCKYPNWNGILLFLAEIYYKLGDSDMALKCLEQVKRTSNFIDGYSKLMAACKIK